MDKIKKLLLKISKKNREGLLGLLELIINNSKDLKIIKIKNTDFFRVRFKQFRIIFHKDDGEVVIDSIKLRNENTYKNL
jgi:mRNA-degrading endonuclease RelE of RelBE toxin-antitoxin system